MQRRMEKDTSCLQGNLTTSLEKCIYIYRFTGNAPPSARALSHVL